MMRMIAAILIVIMPLMSMGHHRPSMVRYRSPSAVASGHDGRLLYVAETTGTCVSVLDAATGEIVRKIELDDPPSDLAVSGSLLYVTTALPDGAVLVIDAESGRVLTRIRAGHMPRSPIVASAGEALYVLNRFENVVSFIDLGREETVARVRVPREPIDAALTPDGRTLVVLGHLPPDPSNAEAVAAEVTFIDTRSAQVVYALKLPTGSTSGRGICCSPDGRFAFCTHILARYQNPTTQLVRGWMNTNACSIVDVKKRQLYATVLLDDVDLGAANPWAAVCDDEGVTLAITHAGTHEVSLIDLPRLLSRLAGMTPEARENVSDDLSFLVGLRRRIELPGRGPRAACFVGSDLVIAEYFSDSVSVVESDGAGPRGARVRAIALAGPVSPDPAMLGEMYFNDASLCFQGWQSCASCHPDGRADGLNWDLLNDGFGNPKNTKSLLFAHETPPAMITGIRASAEVAVRAGVRHIQFASRPDEDMQAIDEYLRTMKAISSPYLVEGELSPAARRGHEVFEKAQCAACHVGEYHTDLRQYDLGLACGQDEGRPMDTPALAEIWRTAPYLHDGRAADLRSLLTEHNPDDRHGRTSQLSESELRDLIAYLLSL